MKKYIVKIEFRYDGLPIISDGGTYKNKIITIGIKDNLQEAIEAGNKVLKKLESVFDLHEFPDGRKATEQRFSTNGGCFGRPNTLISNMAYLKTPFQFFASIETLNIDNLDESINDILNSINELKTYDSEVTA